MQQSPRRLAGTGCTKTNSGQHLIEQGWCVMCGVEVSRRTIVGIDPGPTQSAYVVLSNGVPSEFKKLDNDELLYRCGLSWDSDIPLVIEQIAAMGMAVGEEVFETVFWSGRFAETWGRQGREWHRIKRHQVKMHWCNSTRAKDTNIRQAIIDSYGGKDRAIGTKKSPGPLHGIAGDCWQALALAICYYETTQRKS